MKGSWNIVKQYAPWLGLLLCIDGFAALLLWLADVRAFRALTGVILLATVLVSAGALAAAGYRAFRREQAFLEFLNTPDEKHEEMLVKLAGPAQTVSVRRLGETLRDRERLCARATARAEDYEEYVETWAHEIKTPLSLLTLLLDNRREEFPESVGYKLDVIRNRMHEYVEQMLYYARLKSTHKDYLFEQLDIRECVDEVLEDYRILLNEKKFDVTFPAAAGPAEEKAYVDRRGLYFILSQIISNAVKYSGEDPTLEISFSRSGYELMLRIRNSGMGVRSCDLPHIFEKGFTGGTGDGRKNATGMGLYLAKGVAGEMNLKLEAASEWGKGFEIRVSFPGVD